MTIYKPAGQREIKQYLYSIFMFTVKPLVKADISRISPHLLTLFLLSTILKKREERKHRGKRNEDSKSVLL